MVAHFALTFLLLFVIRGQSPFMVVFFHFSFNFLLLGVKDFFFSSAFYFLISPLNNKIFDGKLLESSKKCSHNYMHSNFKRRRRKLFLIGILHLH